VHVWIAIVIEERRGEGDGERRCAHVKPRAAESRSATYAERIGQKASEKACDPVLSLLEKPSRIERAA
jgi:hypothetical protein